MAVPVALVPLDRSSAEPLWRQLADALVRRITGGELAPGTRLPSSRMLADDLGLSRGTVAAAFDQLLAEGWLEGRRGAGTFVAPRVTRLRSGPAGRGPQPALSRRGETIADSVRTWRPTLGTPRPFRPGVPAADLFPWPAWRGACNRVLRSSRADLFGYGDPGGFPPLREAIASYVRIARGLRCTPSQVIVVEGAQQGLDFALRLLTDPGDAVAAEDPGYLGARAAMQAAGARIVPIGVDSQGIDVDALRRADPVPKLVYASPSNQFPLGITMPRARREALLGWARDTGAWIVEDDYDSEFRYAALPVPSLHSLDTDGRVVYVGSLSKVLFPGLRVGYLVVPERILEGVLAARFLAGIHAPFFHQAVLADFMASGHLLRHIRRMRSAYAERQQALRRAGAEHLAGLVEIDGAETGMKLTAWLPRGVDDIAMAGAARRAGVDVYPLSRYWYGAGPERGGFLVGYAGYTPNALNAAAAILGSVLRREWNLPGGR
jgi:GntR family transcriptional regulator/MocR family aminotransferase